MRRFINPGIALAVLLPLSAWAASNEKRVLASGKLDAAQSYDFSCSLVNKSQTHPFDVTLTLKDGDGNIYVDPSTFQQATLDTTLAPGEAAMLVAPAGFVGVTSLYCWAQAPKDANVFGTLLVRDAQDRSTAATPLVEDLVGAFFEILGKAEEIDQKLDWLLGGDT